MFWQVGSSATLGTTTTFVGNILALTSITLTTGARVIRPRAGAQRRGDDGHQHRLARPAASAGRDGHADPGARGARQPPPRPAATATAVTAATATAITAATATAIATLPPATQTAIVATATAGAGRDRRPRSPAPPRPQSPRVHPGTGCIANIRSSKLDGGGIGIPGDGRSS